MCEVEAVNAVVALKHWTSQLQWKNVVLHSDSATVVAVFQARLGRDPFFQACTRYIWWTCTVNNITLSVVHIPGEQLTDSADALSQYHLEEMFKDRVHTLSCHCMHIIPVSHALFKLSPDLYISFPYFRLSILLFAASTGHAGTGTASIQARISSQLPATGDSVHGLLPALSPHLH